MLVKAPYISLRQSPIFKLAKQHVYAEEIDVLISVNTYFEKRQYHTRLR